MPKHVNVTKLFILSLSGASLRHALQLGVYL